MSGGASPARRGAGFEYRCKTLLEDDGFWVTRTPGSKSPADLIAVRRGLVLAVQCKLGGSMSAAERARLYQLGAEFGMTPMLAVPGAQRGMVAWARLVDAARLEVYPVCRHEATVIETE